MESAGGRSVESGYGICVAYPSCEDGAWNPVWDDGDVVQYFVVPNVPEKTVLIQAESFRMSQMTFQRGLYSYEYRENCFQKSETS